MGKADVYRVVKYRSGSSKRQIACHMSVNLRRQSAKTRNSFAARAVIAFLLRTVFSLSAFAFVLSPLTRAEVLDFRDAAEAPPSWAQFAKAVRDRFEAWLSADDEVANRFRAYVMEHNGKERGPPQTLVVKAWLSADGTVERVSFPPLSDADADEDLHTILRGNVGEAPPPEMLQPLNLRLSFPQK